jgi:CysZ protein
MKWVVAAARPGLVWNDRRVISEFLAGIGYLGRGLGYWRRRPRLMLLGLLPALLAFVLLIAALVPLFWHLDVIAAAITPFADGWSDGWRIALRIGAGAAVGIGGLVLAWAVFTALALAIGDPFYQRISDAVEHDLGRAGDGTGSSLGATVLESVRLLLLGLLATLVTVVLGLVPGIGGVLSAVLGVVLTGRLLARELTDRAFDAHDVLAERRRTLRRGSRARVLGFGVVTQLCFLVPLGAIVTMPAAVAGATVLAGDLADGAEGSVSTRPSRRR